MYQDMNAKVVVTIYWQVVKDKLRKTSSSQAEQASREIDQHQIGFCDLRSHLQRLVAP